MFALFERKLYTFYLKKLLSAWDCFLSFGDIFKFKNLPFFRSTQLDGLAQKDQWSGLKTIIMLEETQESNDKTSTERHFLSAAYLCMQNEFRMRSEHIG